MEEQSRKPYLFDAILTLLIFLIGEAVIGLGFYYAASQLHLFQLTLTSTLTEISIFALLLLQMKMQGIGCREGLWLAAPGIKAVAFTGVLWLSTTFLVNFAVVVIRELLKEAGFDISYETEILDRQITETVSLGWGTAVLGLCVVPAVCEEAVFRGLIFNGVRNSTTLWAGVIASSAIFALVHSTYTQRIATFILGLLFSLVMLGSGSIVCAMLFHFLNNLTAVFAKNIPVLEEETAAFMFLASVPVAVLCITWFVLQIRKRVL